MTDHLVNGIAARLLKEASNEYSNHTCNDMDSSIFSGMSDGDMAVLEADYNLWNAGATSEDHDQWCPFYAIPDYAWMDYCAYKLENAQ